MLVLSPQYDLCFEFAVVQFTNEWEAVPWAF